MEKMAVLGIEIAQTIEAPRKKYRFVDDGGSAHYLSLTNDQINFLRWLDDKGMLYEYEIEEVGNMEFEKI